MKFFKKTKIDNSLDLEATMVTLPKSGKDKTIAQIVNDADEHEMHKNDDMAKMEHKVKLHDGTTCNVGELIEKHKTINEEHEALKKKYDEMEKEPDLHTEKESVDVEGDKHNDDDDSEGKQNDDESEKDKHKNEDGDEEARKKALELAKHEEKEIAAKKKNALDAEKKKNFESLKNAHLDAQQESARIVLSEDMVARGKSRYGSGK